MNDNDDDATVTIAEEGKFAAEATQQPSSVTRRADAPLLLYKFNNSQWNYFPMFMGHVQDFHLWRFFERQRYATTLLLLRMMYSIQHPVVVQCRNALTEQWNCIFHRLPHTQCESHRSQNDKNWKRKRNIILTIEHPNRLKKPRVQSPCPPPPSLATQSPPQMMKLWLWQACWSCDRNLIFQDLNFNKFNFAFWRNRNCLILDLEKRTTVVHIGHLSSFALFAPTISPCFASTYSFRPQGFNTYDE